MDARPPLIADGLRYIRRGIILLNDVSLQVQRGEIVVLLGTNGAGKSTLLNLLAGVLSADGGHVLIGEDDVHSQPLSRRQMGYLPDRPPLYDELTIEEQLGFSASLFGIPPAQRQEGVNAAMTLWQLDKRRGQLTGALSKGWRQRCGLAQATLHKPDFLLLDEPGEGLDPQQLMQMRQTLRELAAGGTGILFSTHLLDETRQLADRVLILQDGKIRHEVSGTPLGQTGLLEDLLTSQATDAAS